METMDLSIDDIRFTKGFDDYSKRPTEYILFLQWIKDFICLTKLLSQEPNRWYQQLFYINLVGLFDIISKDPFISSLEDVYTKHVKQCVNEMLNVLTDDEFLYVVYKRHSAAHPLQNHYDLFDQEGNKREKVNTWKIRGNDKQLTMEEVLRSIHRILSKYRNDEMLSSIDIRNKLTPHILQLQEGLFERFLQVARAIDLPSSDPQMYETLVQIMKA